MGLFSCFKKKKDAEKNKELIISYRGRDVMKNVISLLMCLTLIAFLFGCEKNQWLDSGSDSTEEHLSVSDEQGLDSENNDSNICLNDYISVSFSGYNHAGYASVSFDKEQFLLDSINLVSFNQRNIAVYREIYGDDGKSPANALCKFIYPKIATDEYLSNGDSVEIIWSFDEEKIETYFECNINYTSEKFVVQGLQEATTYDPFKNAEIFFSSIAPYGKAKFSCYDSYNGKYTLSKSEGLSNGDTVTVTYSCGEIYDMIALYGTYPSIYEKTYTVSGLKSFPNSIDDFPDNILADINRAAGQYFSKFPEGTNYGIVVKNYSIEGYAFIIPTVNVDYAGSSFYAIYSVDAKAVYKDQSKDMHYYVMFNFNNPIIENGVCSMNTSNYDIPSHTTKAAEFSEPNSSTLLRADGFNTKAEIEDYLNNYIGSRSQLLFQTYK